MSVDLEQTLNLNLDIAPLRAKLPPETKVSSLVSQYGFARFEVLLDVYFGDVNGAVRRYVEDLLTTVGMNYPKATIEELHKKLRE